MNAWMILTFILAMNLVIPAWASPVVEIPAGVHIPFLSDGDGENTPVEIKAFFMDEYPVTNSEYSDFVRQNEKWKKSKIIRLYADENYLKHWRGDLLSVEEKLEIGDKPVVNISWFAAKAYCQSRRMRLANTNEWEYSSDANNTKNITTILKWYGTTNNGELATIKKMEKVKFGPRGMHGHIWEWVNDFNSVLITQDSRNEPSDKLEGLFCGGGSLRSKNAADYASFMRYAFRSGLTGQYTYSLLGLRCVRDMEKE